MKDCWALRFVDWVRGDNGEVLLFESEVQAKSYRQKIAPFAADPEVFQAVPLKYHIWENSENRYIQAVDEKGLIVSVQVIPRDGTDVIRDLIEEEMQRQEDQRKQLEENGS